MDYRNIWVHGIGPIAPGYSAGWTQAFNAYLNLPVTDFTEVIWNTAYTDTSAAAGAAGVTRGGDVPAPITLTDTEQQEAERIRADLRAGLWARTAALSSPPAAAATRGLAVPVDWVQYTRPEAMRGLLPDWLTNPEPYLGEFVKYLANREIRTAVKEKFKEQVRPLAGTDVRVSILAHSWGTVVAYESLLDLQTELPTLQIANLVTLGCPLWVTRPFLDDRSGRKPAEDAAWLNIFAQFDVVGAPLSASFQVDHDYGVPDFGGGDPHGSYFVPGNVMVQRDIVAPAILE
jgi:metacaspase-1